MATTRSSTLTRRQVLGKSAAVGGALWVAPTVTAISLTEANAATPSGVSKTPPPETPREPPSFEPPDTPTDGPTTVPSPETPVRSTPGTPGGSGSGGSGGAGGSGGSNPTAGDRLPDTGIDDITTKALVSGALIVGGAAAVATARASRTPIDETSGSSPT